MAGTPEKMLEYLLETRLDSKKEDEIGMWLLSAHYLQRAEELTSSFMYSNGKETVHVSILYISELKNWIC